MNTLAAGSIFHDVAAQTQAPKSLTGHASEIEGARCKRASLASGICCGKMETGSDRKSTAARRVIRWSASRVRTNPKALIDIGVRAKLDRG